MKLTKTQTLFLAVIIPLTAITALSSIVAIKETYANKAYEAAFNEAKTDRQILISKIETLNKVNSMYETSYKTGFSNCIKTNPELTCSKKYKQIANHFSNEYDTKLLKILADQSGIALSEHFATGKITAVNNTLEYDDEIAGLVKYYSSVVSQDIQDLNNNKDEVVSIGGKFAELGLKAQNENSKELTDIKRLLDLVVAEEERNVGAGNAAPVGKAPSLMDTVIASGKGLFGPANNSGEKSLEAYKSIMERLDLEEAQKGAFGVGKAPDLTDKLVNSGKTLFNASVSVNNNSQIYQDYVNAYNSAAIKANEIYIKNETYKNNGGNN